MQNGIAPPMITSKMNGNVGAARVWSAASRLPIRGPCASIHVHDRRCLHSSVAVASSSNGNGAVSPLWPQDGFETIDVNGKKFVRMDQAITAMENADAALAKGKAETAALQSQLATMQATIAEQEEQMKESHKQMVDVARTSRTHYSTMKEQEEELTTLRKKIATAVQETQAARQAEANAVSIAIEQLEAKVSKAYLSGRDKQLSNMERRLKAALDATAAAQEATVRRVRAAEDRTLEAVQTAVGRLEAEATTSTRLAAASAASARSSTEATTDSVQRALRQQMETTSLAQQLFSEAKAATERAAAAHAECNALQNEVKELREQLKEASDARAEALRLSAENQAESVKRIRQALEESEGRIQEMYHAFEALKHNERQNARAARDEASHHAHRCKEAEERERGLIKKEEQLREALSLALSRAVAAEEKLGERSTSLEAEFAQQVELLRQQTSAEKEKRVTEAMDNALKAAQEMLDRVQNDAEAAQANAAAELGNVRKMLETAAEESKYWEDRARRAENTIKALQHDIKLAVNALPEEKSKLKLRFQSQEMIMLLENGPSDLPAEEANGASQNGNGSGDWLPPPPGKDWVATAPKE